MVRLEPAGTVIVPAAIRLATGMLNINGVETSAADRRVVSRTPDCTPRRIASRLRNGRRLLRGERTSAAVSTQPQPDARPLYRDDESPKRRRDRQVARERRQHDRERGIGP